METRSIQGWLIGKAFSNQIASQKPPDRSCINTRHITALSQKYKTPNFSFNSTPSSEHTQNCWESTELRVPVYYDRERPPPIAPITNSPRRSGRNRPEVGRFKFTPMYADNSIHAARFDQIHSSQASDDRSRERDTLCSLRTKSLGI